MPSNSDPHESGTIPAQRVSATLHDVARVAGVAIVTVSRVLNHPDKVSEATAKRVRSAIAQTGYVPNLLAGALVSQRSRLVIIVIPTLAHRAFVNTVNELARCLEKARYQLLIYQSGYLMDDEATMIDSLLSRRPDGIVLTTPLKTKTARDRLTSRKIPVIETWQLHHRPIDEQVGFSHEAVGTEMGAYMAAKGYRRVGMLWSQDERAQLRGQACHDALEAAGVEVLQLIEMPVPVTVHFGREGLTRLLASHRWMDAVICSIDILAQGVIIEAQRRGLRIPQDLAVMGFGDLEFAADLYPALTTVRVDAKHIGKLTAELLLARFAEQGTGTRQSIDIGFKIVEREST